MPRASRYIHLALIGSIACLAGFFAFGSRRWGTPSSQPAGGGYHYWSRGYGGYGGSSSSIGASARGGFGAHGAASGG